LGDGFQGLLGGADDGRQDEDAQGQGAGEDAGAELQEDHEETQPEEAEDDGGHPGQAVDAYADRPDDLPLLGVFCEIDGGHDPEGESHGDGPDGEIKGSQDRRHDAPFGHGIRGGQGQEVPGDDPEAVDENVKEQAPQGGGENQGGEADDPEEDLLFQITPFHGAAHVLSGHSVADPTSLNFWAM